MARKRAPDPDPERTRMEAAVMKARGDGAKLYSVVYEAADNSVKSIPSVPSPSAELGLLMRRLKALTDHIEGE